MRMPMLALLAAVMVLAPTLAQDACESGWKEYTLFSAGSCYLFVKQAVEWKEALNRCTEQSAVLVSLHVEAENSFVTGQMMTNGLDSVWTGGMLGMDGSFSWRSGEPPADNWSKWSPGQPDSYQAEGSILVLSSSFMTFGRWRDELATDKYFYVCERPPGPPAAPATVAPETQAPVTVAPETQAPATVAPETQAPATEAPTPTPVPVLIQDCFTVTPNTQAHVADRYAGIDDLDSCLTKCLEIGCKSLDWDRKNPAWQNIRCWIYTPPRRVDASETNAIQGVDHYSFIEGSACVAA